VYKIFNLFCKLFMRLEVHGRENLKSEGSTFIVCPNHQSFIDPFVLCSTYSFDVFRRTFHVGASEFFEGRLMQALARMLNVVPVNPDTELMKAMKAGAIGLRAGKILNIYPEGERAFDGELHMFKKGAAILATELDLPIVPVAMDGLYKVWPRKSMRIRPAKVKITIGKPFFARDVIAEAQLTSTTAAAASSATAIVSSTLDTSSTVDEYAIVTRHLKSTIAAMLEQMRS